MIVKGAYEVFCWCCVLGVPFSHEFFGWTGLFVHTIIICGLSIYIDWCISPTFQTNMHRLSKHGFNTSAIFAVMAGNLIATNVLVVFVKEQYCPGVLLSPLSVDRLRIVGIVLVNMALAEIAFTLSHMLLHRTHQGARWHLMHHCCRPSSWSTNLIFHPIDMAIEFSGPVIVLLLSHIFVFRNPTALLTSVQVLHLWYAIDHSENLKLPHYTHHMRIDAMYSIYIKTRNIHPEKDRVKLLLRSLNGNRSELLTMHTK